MTVAEQRPGKVLGASTEAQATTYPLPLPSFVTHDELSAALDAVTKNLQQQIARNVPVLNFSGPAATTPINTATFAVSQKIDQLQNVTLTNATVNGLTDADIPDSITASNYLPLTGGTLTGDLTMSGTLTAGSLSVAGISSSGALIGPYVSATSTTATSTFSGGLFANYGAFNSASVGVTATTTIDSAGNLSVAGNSNFANATTSLLFVKSALGASAASFGGTATSTFSSNGSLTLGGNIILGNNWLSGDGGNEGIQVANDGTVSIGGSWASFGNALLVLGNKAILWAPTDGNLRLTNAAQTSFGLLQLGGTSASFPSIKRNGAGIDFRLADDSAYATTTASGGIFNGFLGIGQTSPTYKLDVTGLGHFTGLVDAANFVATSTSATTTLAGQLAVGSNALNVLSNGNVGIGTASPLSIVSTTRSLEVAGVAYSTIFASTGSGNVRAEMYADNSNNLVGFGSYSNSRLDFFVNNGNPSMSISTGGNVGIGTTSPSAKLSITGGGTGTGRAFAIANSSNVEHFTVLDDGTVKIPELSSPVVAFQRTADGNYSGSLQWRNNAGTTKWVLGNDAASSANNWYLKDSVNATTPFFVSGAASGNIGIGTTSPPALLTVYSSSASVENRVETQLSSGYAFTRYKNPDTTGDLYIGKERSSGNGLLTGDTGNAGVFTTTGNLPIQFGTNDTVRLTVLGGGNIGVASTTPWRTLSVTGTVGFDGLTSSTDAGSLCLDSNKQVVYNSASDNCLSSTRATKHAIDNLSLDGLRIIDTLQPVSFVYNQGDGRTRYGFIAEDTAAVDAHLATYYANGTVSGIDDRSIIAILVGAVKELAATVHGFADRFVTRELVATNVTADRGTFNELCVGKVCITESQFLSVFGASASQSAAAAGAADTHTSAATGGAPEAAEAAASGPPIIDSSGDNSATINASTTASSTPAASPAAIEDPPALPDPANDNQPEELQEAI